MSYKSETTKSAKSTRSNNSAKSNSSVKSNSAKSARFAAAVMSRPASQKSGTYVMFHFNGQISSEGHKTRY